MMEIFRPFWLEKLNQAWKKKSIVWLHGVRRAGKTSLSKQVKGSLYFNCDLPAIRRELEEDPVSFLDSLPKGSTLVLDEIHQLEDPSTLLKIAADEYAHLKVLATGSSTLQARKKIRDTLTDRKRTLHLTPVMVEEIADFGSTLDQRLLRGGLPPALLHSSPEGVDQDFYQEWMDSFYSRDIQEEYEVEKRQPFLKILEFLLLRNGGLLEVTELAKVSGLSRPTAVKYLEALEGTKAITVLRPYSATHAHSLLSQPKVYGFDTGFVCHAKGIEKLRPDDKGGLLENLTLETLQAHGMDSGLFFWRTKEKQEIDFIWKPGRGATVHAIECKSRADTFDPSHFVSFRKGDPLGKNLVVTIESSPPRKKKMKGLDIEFRSIFQLPDWIRGV